MSDKISAGPSFSDLKLAEPLLRALDDVGYETPSPIQAQAIPPLLQGLDLLGHAPTGTGKTAAFALPLLSRIDTNNKSVQVMVLTPTRELAIQVAEAFQKYASHIRGFHVAPIYGGQEYGIQIRALKRGVQVIVGTPGRLMDHMRKGTLKLGGLQALVLDEADEMLRMGFIDEVEWILEQTPDKRQMALFSATMPKEIARIARKHLNDPQEVSIKTKTATAETIRQRYWLVSGMHKLDAFTRILEVESFDAILVFTRTKIMTTELADKLAARGFAAAAMNGDMAQKDREKMVERLKKGSLDILVATDVAARGLDVKRISHVVNYDIPNDTEAYIHRIGRTGRAGRQGDAILFVAPRERRMLRAIEKATNQKIEPLELPSTETVNNKRIADFKQRITDTLAAGELAFMQGVIEQYQHEHDVPPLEIAAALSKMSLGDKPLLMKDRKERPARSHERSNERSRGHDRGDPKSRKARGEPRGAKDLPPLPRGMERFLLEVGYAHGVKPGNIVGAIANEAGVDGQNIGHIEISDDFSIVDLPEGMPKEIFNDLKKVRVCGQALKIVHLDSGKPDRGRRAESSDRSERKHGDKKGAPARRSAEKRSAGKSSGKKSGKHKSRAKGPGGKKTAVKKATPKKKVRKRDQLNKGAPKPRARKKFAKTRSSGD